MESNLKKKGLLTILGCLMFSIAIMFGAMFSGNSTATFASETDDKLAPAIVSVAGVELDPYFTILPMAVVGEEYKAPNGENYKVIATGSGTLTYHANEYGSGVYNALPKGLHLNSTTGEIYGTPEEYIKAF